MTVSYDKHYETENLFGEPYPELINFFTNLPQRGKLLDLGCGQGRNAISLARLGYEVTGIDNSLVGVRQMQQTAKLEGLKLIGLVNDIYSYRGLANFDYILLDSMFHFRKSELKQESELVERVINQAKSSTLIVFCIQNYGNKIATLNKVLDKLEFQERTIELDFSHSFESQTSSHRSETNYKMIVIKK